MSSSGDPEPSSRDHERRPSDPEPPPSEPERRLRIHSGELISATCALLLLTIMFALAWYGVVEPTGHIRSGMNSAENAWHGLSTVRWLMLLTAAVALGSVILHATQRSHGTRTDTSLAVAAFGTLTAGLLVYRVLVDLPASDEVVDAKLGAFLGLLSAIGIALGGYESMREERARRKRLVQRSRTRSRLASSTHAR
jgi:hypothetical protein